MKKVFALFCSLLFAAIGHAQTYNIFQPGGDLTGTWNSQILSNPISHAVTVNGTLTGNLALSNGLQTLIHPVVTDPAPIIQNGGIVYTDFAVPYQYYTDPVLQFGYNLCANGAICNATDPWQQSLDNENDYAFVVSNYTVNSSTTTTVAAFTGTQSLSGAVWAANQFTDWSLYDLTHNCASVISSNTVGTAATITVSPAMTCMVSGDTVQLILRTTENRWGATLYGTGVPTRFPVFQWNSDKGTSIANNALYLTEARIGIPSKPCVGLEFVPDYLVNTAGSGADAFELTDCTGSPNFVINGGTGPGSGNPGFSFNGAGSPSIKIQGGGHSGQYWISDNDGNYGDFLMYAYTNAGVLRTQLEWDPQANYMKFGNATGNPAFNFLGTGTAAFGGNITVNGGIAINPVFTGTTPSIGGVALVAGTCSSTSTTVTGATVGMVVDTTPNTYPGDSSFWKSYVSAANTIITLICESVAGTPTASTYNLRVIQ